MRLWNFSLAPAASAALARATVEMRARTVLPLLRMNCLPLDSDAPECWRTPPEPETNGNWLDRKNRAARRGGDRAANTLAAHVPASHSASESGLQYRSKWNKFSLPRNFVFTSSRQGGAHLPGG